mgnify:CR=1 FL=1
MADFAGRVGALWRYPVSSLGGERLDSAHIEPDGVAGDRQWGVADAETGGVAGPEREKRWRIAPEVSARLAGEGAEIRLGGGDWMPAGGEAARAALAAHFGFPVEIRPHPGWTDGGAEAVQPRYERAAIHLLTTSSLAVLRRILPDAVIDERRFRPNLVLDTGEDSVGFTETGWIGRRIGIGEAELRIVEPCERCAFTMIGQPGLPFDKRILAAISSENGKGFGVLCCVVRPGTVALGDEARLSR